LFQLGNCNYNVNETLKLRPGDGLLGVVGSTAKRPVRGAYPTNLTSTITCVNNLDQGIKPAGGGQITIRWVRVTGCEFDGSSGSGVGLAMGSAADNSVVEYSRFDHNTGVGISNARGVYNYVEVDHNGSEASVRFIAGGIKANRFSEVKNSWAHDNVGNGLWCDNGCAPASSTLFPNGYWVHNVEASANTGAGIRYENAPTKTLIEDSHVYGNSTVQNRGGIDVRDGQNALVRNNIAGGNGYPHNSDNIFIRATDSGKADRTNLQNVDIVNNVLAGEVIKGCELPDNIVACSGNN
jgi:hypothetical protein